MSDGMDRDSWASGQVEKVLSHMEDDLRRLRVLIGYPEEPADVRWARMLLSVLAEIDRRGGRIPSDELLEIAETYGYSRRGIGGFYQNLLFRPKAGYVDLTRAGRRKLEELRGRYRELSPTAVQDPLLRP